MKSIDSCTLVPQLWRKRVCYNWLSKCTHASWYTVLIHTWKCNRGVITGINCWVTNHSMPQVDTEEHILTQFSEQFVSLTLMGSWIGLISVDWTTGLAATGNSRYIRLYRWRDMNRGDNLYIFQLKHSQLGFEKLLSKHPEADIHTVLKSKYQQHMQWLTLISWQYQEICNATQKMQCIRFMTTSETCIELYAPAETVAHIYLPFKQLVTCC